MSHLQTPVRPLLALRKCLPRPANAEKPLCARTEDPSDPAFHVVIPSLPGFVWSSPPPSGKHYIGDLFGYARILNALMFGLGYGQGGAGSCWSGYAVQGTDWGSFHARVLANLPGTAAKAVHLNFLPPPPGKSWGAAAAAAAAAAKDSKFKANAKSKTQRATRAAEPVRDVRRRSAYITARLFVTPIIILTSARPARLGRHKRKQHTITCKNIVRGR